MLPLLQCSWKNVWVVYFKSLTMQLIGWYDLYSEICHVSHKHVIKQVECICGTYGT